jgi:hypothetical protein
MNLFHLHIENEHGGMHDERNYLVIADSLFDAISFVPEGFRVKGIDIQVVAVAGPGRVIGCFAAPTVH